MKGQMMPWLQESESSFRHFFLLLLTSTNWHLMPRGSCHLSSLERQKPGLGFYDIQIEQAIFIFCQGIALEVRELSFSLCMELGLFEKEFVYLNLGMSNYFKPNFNPQPIFPFS